VGRLEIAQPAVLDERDPAARQLELQEVGVVAGAEQHRLSAQVHTLLTRREHSLAHLPGLLAFVARKRKLWRLPTLALGPQPLGKAQAILGGDGVRNPEDRRGRTVVALERDGAGARKLLGEVEDVAGARRAKPVDRLEVVADDGQPRAPATQAADDLHLQAVDVLVLIDEHVVERIGDARPEHLVAGERAPIQQQIVEVDHAERALARPIGAKDLGERPAMLSTPRKGLRQHLLQGRLRVDGTRVDVEHRLRAREAPGAACVALFLAHVVEQVGRVARVEHAEAGLQPERGGVQAHHPVCDRVERAAHDRARVRRHPLRQRARPLDHLARRAPRERQQQDPLGRDALAQQPRHACAQRRRLAGAGAGEDQQRPARVCRRLALLGIEPVEPGRRFVVVEHLFAR
jgi:hypothetical protein